MRIYSCIVSQPASDCVGHDARPPPRSSMRHTTMRFIHHPPSWPQTLDRGRRRRMRRLRTCIRSASGFCSAAASSPVVHRRSVPVCARGGRAHRGDSFSRAFAVAVLGAGQVAVLRNDGTGRRSWRREPVLCWSRPHLPRCGRLRRGSRHRSRRRQHAVWIPDDRGAPRQRRRDVATQASNAGSSGRPWRWLPATSTTTAASAWP